MRQLDSYKQQHACGKEGRKSESMLGWKENQKSEMQLQNR
jgi:hypothetical protein